MKIDNSILNGYENTKLIRYDEITSDFPNTVPYDDLPNRTVPGVLKANQYVDGKLVQTYSKEDTHALVVAATRQGKTTSFVIPQVLSFAKQATKKSMIISDPKGELYRTLTKTLKDEGYDVLLLNLRDFKHSELWNPLTPLFQEYNRTKTVEDEVELVETPDGLRNRFQGTVYQNQFKLDEAIEQMKTLIRADAESNIDKLMYAIIPVNDAVNDQYWDDSSRSGGKAILCAMLEDSEPRKGRTVVTEDLFSFNSMFTILDHLTEAEQYDNDNFFSDRGAESPAYNNAKCIIENASGTRQCIISDLRSKLLPFRNSSIRLLTASSSFEMSRLTDEKPVAVFISYPDESKATYHVISSFIQDAYSYLIECANGKPNGKLERPFYFILDEFGNFPKITDFENVISACGGRNIWFNIVLQSYAQLDRVYGKETSGIIRDNLNMHIFMGSNNPSTLTQFCEECGLTTRIAPRSALNGDKREIDRYEIETIPLIPRSSLSALKPGECIVTEVNSGYVLFSRLERYYLCKEFMGLELSSEKDYYCSVNPLDKRFNYVFRNNRKKRTEDAFGS